MSMPVEQRVRLLLAAIPYYQERQYSGNYYDNDDINDITDAIRRAGLTERQRQVIELLYIRDMTQVSAGRILGLKRNSVNELEGRAVLKIIEAYERGNRDEYK